MAVYDCYTLTNTLILGLVGRGSTRELGPSSSSPPVLYLQPDGVPFSGHQGTAVQLLGQVLASFPAAVRPWLQLIGLERRRQNLNECSRLYDLASVAAPEHLRTWWAMKHARFCFKVRGITARDDPECADWQN